MAEQSEVLLLCTDCGREAPSGALFCAACGAPLPGAGASAVHTEKPTEVHGNDPHGGDAATESPKNDTDASATPSARAAQHDIAEARRRMTAGELSAAVILLRNAQALLLADVGTKPSESSLRKLADEAARIEDDFKKDVRPTRRQAALIAAGHSLEPYFRGEKRIPMGEVWVPSDWPTALTPPQIAAVKLSIAPRCKECQGVGAMPCRHCAGKGSVPCKAQGCDGGWVRRKPTATLAPSATIERREKCPQCHGTAVVPCKDCAGKGNTHCKKCGGSGDAPLCKTCRGSGLIDCRDCTRNGIKDDCPKCRGTGKALCGTCGGDGHSQR